MWKRIKIRHILSIVIASALIWGAGCAGTPVFNFDPSFSLYGQYSSETTRPTDSITSLEGAEIVARARASVVTINAELTVKDIFGNSFSDQISGTGWIYDPDGLIITNNHVIKGAQKVTVTLESGQTYIAKKIWTDSIDDLAVINIGASNLPFLSLGDSSMMKAGDWVAALGNANGEGIIATEGVISSTDSVFKNPEQTLYDALETTAPITYGNSGGPLVNMDGEVIGITTAAILKPSGAGYTCYAISSDTAGPAIEQLVCNGCVTRAWMGINASSIGDISSMGCKLPLDKGVMIVEVDPNSPAEKSGLKPGDIIVSFGGKEIARNADLVESVWSSQTGQTVDITYWRDNSFFTVPVVLGSYHNI